MIDKIKQLWSWIKRKIKHILIATGIIGVALAATFIPNGEIPSIIVNGETIVFEYTDDNTGENLIIRTDKQTYGGWDGADVYVMIENISGENQETKIKFIDPKQSEFLFKIGRLEKDVPYQITVSDYETITYDCSDATTTKTCEREELIGTHQEMRYKDEWQELEDIDNEAEFTLPKDKIAYFKTKITFPHQTEGEFFIEITGDKQGWGHLK